MSQPKDKSEPDDQDHRLIANEKHPQRRALYHHIEKNGHFYKVPGPHPSRTSRDQLVKVSFCKNITGYWYKPFSRVRSSARYRRSEHRRSEDHGKLKSQDDTTTRKENHVNLKSQDNSTIRNENPTPPQFRHGTNKLGFFKNIPYVYYPTSSRSESKVSSCTDPDHLVRIQRSISQQLPSPDVFLAGDTHHSGHPHSQSHGYSEGQEDPTIQNEAPDQPQEFHFIEKNGRFYKIPGVKTSVSSQREHKRCSITDPNHLFPFETKSERRSRHRRHRHRHSTASPYVKKHRRRDTPSTSANQPDQFDQAKSVETSGILVPSQASDQIQRVFDRGEETSPFPGHQLPSLHTSLPVRSRQVPVGNDLSGNSYRPSSMSGTNDGATQSEHTDNRNGTRSAYISGDAELDISITCESQSEESHSKQSREQNALEPVHDYVLANEEDYLVGDASDREDTG